VEELRDWPKRDFVVIDKSSGEAITRNLLV
jgi:hypothetical protein